MNKGEDRLIRKLIALSHVSLDGVVQAPGGKTEDPSHEFEAGGWSLPYGDEFSGKFLNEIFSRSFDLLLGRRTYDIFASYWPLTTEDGLIAKAFNQAQKYVATQTLTEFTWQNTQALCGEAAQAVAALKASDGPEIHVWGSGVFLQTLMKARLVDEYYLFVHPVILGRGKRLFHEGASPKPSLLCTHKKIPRAW